MNPVLRAICLLGAAACLGLGYVLIGAWPALLFIPAMILFWLLAKGRSPFWATCSLLSTYAILAVMAILAHAPALPVAVGSVFALAAWDLSDPRGRTLEYASPSSGLLGERRLRSLAAVAAISILLIVPATAFRLELPFGIVLLLALLLTGCILYAVQYLRYPASHS